MFRHRSVYGLLNRMLYGKLMKQIAVRHCLTDLLASSDGLEIVHEQNCAMWVFDVFIFNL